MQKIGEFVFKDEASVAVVQVEGNYSLINTVKINAEIAEALRQGCTKVRIDLERTRYMDSSAIRDILRVARRIGRENLTIVHAKGRAYTALHAAALDDFMPEEATL